MKVIFLENIKGVARLGDIKSVADGYARNFLFPRNLARSATADTVKHVEALKKKHEVLDAENKERAEQLLKVLSDFTLEINEDANEEGHLYGSIGEKKIVAELKKHAIIIGEDDINLAEHIKTLGEHEVELEPHQGIKATLKIRVVK